MSGLLKAGDRSAQSAVRPLGVPATEAEPAALVLPSLPGADETAVDDYRSELEATIADLRQRLADAASDADEREDAAFERGRREGEDLATSEADKRLELLAAGIDAVLRAHEGRIAEYELLALQLARAALARVFGDEELQAQLVTQTVSRHVAALKRELVLGLRVSPRDFRSSEELAELAGRFSGLEIAQDETLDAGGCVLDLRLGVLDLGLRGQWQRLTAFFEQLAERAE